MIRSLTLSVLLVVGACSSGGTTAATTAPTGLPPVDEPAARAPLDPQAPPTGTFVGVVTTKQSKVVIAEFEGRIEALLVQSGQEVKAGDPIAKLDASQLGKSADAVRSQVAAARAAATQAGIDASEAHRLHALEKGLQKDNASTAEAVRSARAAAARADAARSQAYNAYSAVNSELQRYEALLAHATIDAPLDGVVSMIRLKEGELAVPGTPIARIFDPSDRWVRFAMPADARDPAIKPGARVEVSIPGAKNKPPVVLPATVVGVSSVLEPPLQLTVVEADLDDTRPDTLLAEVGTTVDVRRMP